MRIALALIALASPLSAHPENVAHLHSTDWVTLSISAGIIVVAAALALRGRT